MVMTGIIWELSQKKCELFIRLILNYDWAIHWLAFNSTGLKWDLKGQDKL